MILGLLLLLGASDRVEDEVFERLQRAREQAGVSRLERRVELDRVALERAREVAAMPHARRLKRQDPIEALLEQAGITRFDHATLHLNMNRGYTDPARAHFDHWRDYRPGWTTAMGAELDAVGLATHRAEDGWVIFVAVLLEDRTIPEDPAKLERETIDAVNAVRRERGLGGLVQHEGLDAVARAHSEDMARRGYVEHVSPEGLRAEDRVRRAGWSFARLAENLYKCLGLEDPAGSAVEGWMGSPGHRENILDGRFTETGVGVAIDDDGAVFITQIYLGGS